MDSVNDEQPKVIPPQLIPFQPGQSGNPGGRPRTKLLSKAAREKLGEVNPASGLTYAEEIALALVREARKGNVWAARELRAWTEGKITPFTVTQIQQNVITGTEGENIKQRLLDKFGIFEEKTGTRQQESIR